ncbi:hypothetical protein MAR_008939 [Mya arenaria]|uniref:Uncharacterized protein n=1 Tax=Mya arenaria TaxID=6604 RepID=A0ABY7E5F8_MYAAR|nr:hypothetical protein MAR_008939 [Mya arenaria]
MCKAYISSVILVISLVLATVASGRFLADTEDNRLEKRTMSDQRLAELQALIALGNGQYTPVGHGQIDPWRMCSFVCVLFRPPRKRNIVITHGPPDP